MPAATLWWRCSEVDRLANNFFMKIYSVISYLVWKICIPFFVSTDTFSEIHNRDRGKAAIALGSSASLSYSHESNMCPLPLSYRPWGERRAAKWSESYSYFLLSIDNHFTSKAEDDVWENESFTMEVCLHRSRSSNLPWELLLWCAEGVSVFHLSYPGSWFSNYGVYCCHGNVRQAENWPIVCWHKRKLIKLMIVKSFPPCTYVIILYDIVTYNISKRHYQ